MTPQQADAATLRALGERMQQRGEDGMAALTLQMASWCESCSPLPTDLVEETITAIKTERED